MILKMIIQIQIIVLIKKLIILILVEQLIYLKQFQSQNHK